MIVEKSKNISVEKNDIYSSEKNKIKLKLSDSTDSEETDFDEEHCVGFEEECDTKTKKYDWIQCIRYLKWLQEASTKYQVLCKKQCKTLRKVKVQFICLFIFFSIFSDIVALLLYIYIF